MRHAAFALGALLLISGAKAEPVALVTSMVSPDACPLPPVSFEDRLSAIKQGYSEGGLSGAVARYSALAKSRATDCALYKLLVACGYRPDGSAVLLLNQKEMMPMIVQHLTECSQPQRH